MKWIIIVIILIALFSIEFYAYGMEGIFTSISVFIMIIIYCIVNKNITKWLDEKLKGGD